MILVLNFNICSFESELEYKLANTVTVSNVTFCHILALNFAPEADLVPEQDDLEGVGVLRVGLSGDPVGEVLHHLNLLQLVAACKDRESERPYDWYILLLLAYLEIIRKWTEISNLCKPGSYVLPF